MLVLTAHKKGRVERKESGQGDKIENQDLREGKEGERREGVVLVYCGVFSHFLPPSLPPLLPSLPPSPVSLDHPCMFGDWFALPRPHIY